MYANAKVLVTGGTGMVGIQLVRLLQEAGANIRVASLDDPSRVGADVEFMRGNLMHWEFCQSIVAGMDYVFHLAGVKGSVGIGNSRAATFFVPHLLMNTLMMEAAFQASIQRYLYTSSIAVYHPTETFVEDQAWDGPPHPTDKYAAWAKRMGELQAEAYQAEHGWDRIAIVRPSNIYGPFDNFDPQTAMVIPALISRVAGGEDPLVVWGDGSAIRDFIFSRDVAQGMMLALEKGANCTPVNLGSGLGVSIKEMVESIVDNFDQRPQVKWDTSMPSGQPLRVMDISRAQESLGFTPATSIGQGIHETVEWYLANNDLGASRYSVFNQPNYMAKST